MCKDSSAKYYPDNIEKLQKKAWERYQSLCKEKKRKKSDTMGVSDIKISLLKIKNKGLLSIDKILQSEKKTRHYN